MLRTKLYHEYSSIFDAVDIVYRSANSSTTDFLTYQQKPNRNLFDKETYQH